MDTADWAQEAESFLRKYHKSLLLYETKKNKNGDDNEEAVTDDRNDNSITILSEFFPELDPQEVVKIVQSNPVLKDIDLANFESGPFELFDTVRGWQPVLRRLPSVQNSRLLTLARRNLKKSVKSDPQNLFIISRQQWAVLECVRLRLGMYSDPEVIRVLRHDFNDDTNSDNEVARRGDSKSTGNLRIVNSEDGSSAGRYVVLDSDRNDVSTVSPGDVLHTAIPFVTVPYDFAPHGACFHCGKDLLNTAAATANSGTFSSVRDLSLQCSTCQVSSFAYCSVSCREKHQYRHERECPWIPKLIERCSVTHNGQTQELIPPFKAVLVLRAALSAKHHENEFQDLLKLETHAEQHKEHRPDYAKTSEDLARWMVSEILTTDEIKSIICCSSETDVDDTESQHKRAIACLVDIFFAIHINAISLGPYAVGLFPGMPSMFNHSCLENVTHSWDEVTGDDGGSSVLTFRAVEAISPGDECCISYVDGLHLPTNERTKPLQEFKFFSCRCPRCQSPTEEGRVDAIVEWNQLTTTISGHQTESPSSPSLIDLYKRRTELAEVLYPTFFVSKGLVMEELAHELLDSVMRSSSLHGEQSNDNKRSVKKEAKMWLEQARSQYAVCRGDASMFVSRVMDVLETIKVDFTDEGPETNSSKTTDEVGETNSRLVENESKPSDEDNEDLNIFEQGWHQVLFEIKFYEGLNNSDLEKFARRIKEAKLSEHDDSKNSGLSWASGHRVYEIGYGIRSLILSCQVNGSVLTSNEIIEALEETFEDDIQHVDLVGNSL